MKELYISFIFMSIKVITLKKILKHSQVKGIIIIIIIFIFMLKW